MSDNLIDTAKAFSAKLTQLSDERHRVGQAGLSVLKKLDPEMAASVSELWGDDEDNAADWFTDEVESLGWRTPWQCIAEGEREEVLRILGCILYGHPA